MLITLAVRTLLSKCYFGALPEYAQISWVCKSLKVFSVSLFFLASFLLSFQRSSLTITMLKRVGWHLWYLWAYSHSLYTHCLPFLNWEASLMSLVLSKLLVKIIELSLMEGKEALWWKGGNGGRVVRRPPYLLWPRASVCSLLGLSLILNARRMLQDHRSIVQGCEDITVHKLAPRCPSFSSREVFHTPERAVSCIHCGNFLDSWRVLEVALSIQGAWFLPIMWGTTQPEKVALIQHCRYMDLLHKND